MQKLYNTPEKKAARPWAPILNWLVIVTIYVLAAVAVYHQKIVFAAPPDAAMPDHVAALWEELLVIGINVGVALTAWNMMRKYTGPGPAEALIPAGAEP